MTARLFVFAVFGFGVAPQLLSTTYYVANSGDDSHAGISAEQPWKSLDRVSSFRFHQGDKVLLKAGDSFYGTLQLTAEDSGTESAGIEISSFGAGRASIVAGRQTGISATDVENLTIQNLVVKGDGPTNNIGHGVHIENTRTDRRLNGLVVDSLDVSGFGKHGILVTGRTQGYEDVNIRRCSMHRNLTGGLEVGGKLPWDAKLYAHKNVTVSECRAFDNTGDPNYTQNH